MDDAIGIGGGEDLEEVASLPSALARMKSSRRSPVIQDKVWILVVVRVADCLDGCEHMWMTHWPSVR